MKGNAFGQHNLLHLVVHGTNDIATSPKIRLNPNDGFSTNFGVLHVKIDFLT